MRVSDIIEGMADYLERQPTDRREEEGKRIILAAGGLIERRRKWREWEGTKEFLREHYKGWFNIDLEESHSFVGWLDFLNSRGHQVFLFICDRCDGTGELPLAVLLSGYYATRMMECGDCEGIGMLQGPSYCPYMNCPGRNVHLRHIYGPSEKGMDAIKQAEASGDNTYGAGIKPDFSKPIGL
jgi:hypothetical protein